MMEWQPIETAPKDGTSILTYPHYVVTHWEDKEAFPAPGWITDWEDAVDAYITTKAPRHWMPLPDPPATT